MTKSAETLKLHETKKPLGIQKTPCHLSFRDTMSKMLIAVDMLRTRTMIRCAMHNALNPNGHRSMHFAQRPSKITTAIVT